METQDEEAPPGWVLSTPTRQREVWDLPLLALLLAALLVAAGAAFGDVLGLVAGVSSGVVVAAAAVALLVAARSAYDAQDRSASWRLHVVRVVAGVTVVSVVAVASLTAGLPLGAVFGGVAAVPTAFRFARSVPRLDRLVAAWASGAVAAACAVLATLGLTVPGTEHYRVAAWIGGGVAFGVISLVMAIVQFRIAARTPRD